MAHDGGLAFSSSGAGFTGIVGLDVESRAGFRAPDRIAATGKDRMCVENSVFSIMCMAQGSQAVGPAGNRRPTQHEHP